MSYWLETAGDLRPRPALDGSTQADVAIIGAGYTGLWTAYELMRLDPSLRVLVLERDIAGYGASGRNGGWCTSDTGASLSLLTKRFGRYRARAVQHAMYDAVDSVGRITTAEGIDCDYCKGGLLYVARGDAQIASLHRFFSEYAAAGFADRYELIDEATLQERIRVHNGRAALFSRECAVVHPGKLVRGLAKVVERRGVRICEQTAVTGWSGGRQPVVHTNHGTVRAGVVVIAAEAYVSQLARMHRAVLPIYSLIVLTEPLKDDLWREIGWQGRECMASMRLTVDYLSRTRDGRILVGGRGAPYLFGSVMSERLAHHAQTHEMLRSMLSDWFPPLRGVRFTHAWGGAVGIPRDFIPSIYYRHSDGVAAAYGYTGHGVAFAHLAGRILAELISGKRSDVCDLPFVGRRSPNWEPEPLRWLGVRAVQAGLARLDARRSRSGRAGRRTLVERIAQH